MCEMASCTDRASISLGKVSFTSKAVTLTVLVPVEGYEWGSGRHSFEPWSSLCTLLFALVLLCSNYLSSSLSLEIEQLEYKDYIFFLYLYSQQHSSHIVGEQMYESLPKMKSRHLNLE